MRVGWGFDAHGLNSTPPVILGGVVVSQDFGVEATSDGDVLSHAIIDAVLGACVLGDIGDHFPPDDSALEDADSIVLLEQTATIAMAAGFLITHVDGTVIVEKVKVAPFRAEIRAKLADALGLPIAVVSVKATTTDGLGFAGRSEGIAAVAVATVTRR
jgi:2-C-methyl-D-erythritol 2,4-cyclodiphosphate synthase